MGSSWRTSFDNPSGRTSYCEPASKGNPSTIATASEQCQTPKPLESKHFTLISQFLSDFRNSRPICYPACAWITSGRLGDTPTSRLRASATGCIFCEAPKVEDDEKTLIVHRAQHCYVILNAYPYTNGHVMVVPYAHLDELQKLPAEPAAEMMALTQRIEGVLRNLYRPDGINLGMNIGKAAGAGIAGHIHMHVLPRWVADANFMSVVGEVRVLPETLDVTWKKIRDALAG